VEDRDADLFVLKEKRHRRGPGARAADSMKTVRRSSATKKFRLMVKPETKESDGKVTPAVYENRFAQGRGRSRVHKLPADGKVVVRSEPGCPAFCRRDDRECDLHGRA